MSKLQNNMIREQKDRDVLKYYEVTRVIGEGSMGSIASARKLDSAIGGSAYKQSASGRFLSKVFGTQRKRSATSSEDRSIRKEYAMKTIQLRRITDEFVEELRNEIDILKTLDHPNIVKAYEVFENKNQIYIVMENCSGGDLYARNPYSEKEAAKIVGKLLSAVAYMHEKNVVHRDIKFENILFESNEPDAEIKVIDFGLSKKFLPGDRYMTRGVGTIYTMAPQVIQGVYTSQADLWSVGVITYMLLSSCKPFPSRKRRVVIDTIMRCDYNFDGSCWEHVSKEGVDFVSSLIKLDPNERLNAKAALRHPWLSKEFPLSERKPSDATMNDVKESLSNFGANSELKKLALMVIAHKSSTEEIIKLRQAFDQYDSTNDGKISLKEFKEVLQEFHYTDEELESIFCSVDVNNNGVIYFTEFLAATLEIHGHIEEERIAEAFDRIDSDDTGYISKQNLMDILGTDYTAEGIEKLFEEADTKKNGKITFKEFLRAFRRTNNDNCKKMARQDTTESEDGLLNSNTEIPGGKHEIRLEGWNKELMSAAHPTPGLSSDTSRAVKAGQTNQIV